MEKYNKPRDTEEVNTNEDEVQLSAIIFCEALKAMSQGYKCAMV